MSLEKVGPMCRRVDDCTIVMHAILGADGLDLAVADGVGLSWDGTSLRFPTRVGYVPAMFEAESDAERRANNERAFATLRTLGCTLHEVKLPDGDLTHC